MTDAGYVLGGYGVTVAAIGAYVGHMWARERTLSRATRLRPDGSPSLRSGTEPSFRSGTEPSFRSGTEPAGLVAPDEAR